MSSKDEARRLAVGLVIAVHDYDRTAFTRVVAGADRAELVDAGLLVNARGPGEARRMLTDLAIRLAVE